ncbi:MAG: TIGR01777 family oxidoreductase [Archangium sp.]|nr:TIGR01777 family oxidoreductase [Archangium sp.]
MAIFERRAVMPVSAEEVFAWHGRPGAFERLNPSFDPVEVEERSGGLEVGARTVIRMSLGPVKQRWVAEHTAYEPGRMFRDEQKDGPFSKWVHTHLFEPRADGTCELVDRIEYELPLGAMGRMVAQNFTTDTLERMFSYRQALTHSDLLRHRAYANRAPLTIAVTGASGLVAGALIPFLSGGGHTVKAVKRQGDGFDATAFDGADVVINLAGAGVADERWSDERKALLRDSRIAYTAKLFDAVAARGSKPKVWLQGSAVGVYGTRGDEVLSDRGPLNLPPREGDRRAAAFLSDLCVDWEAAANPAAERFGSRVVAMRIGIVQSARGGALAKMLPAFKMGVGGPLAGGKSWQACIALEDLLGQILFLIMNDGVSGAVNCVGPSPTTSLDYARVLGKVLRRPAIAPLPAFALRTMFGELADGALLASQRAVPDRLTDAGFRFWQPDLEDALRFTLGK